MSSIKLAVIGTGLIGQKHLEIVSANADCELVAVCDVQPEGKATAERYGVPFYQDYARLLAEETLQGAIIATPTHLHTPVGIACAEHGVHILVEKPISTTIAQAKQLLEMAELCHIQVLVGHHRRHNPLVQQARIFIQNNEIGKLVAVSVLWALLKPSDYYDVAWRTQPGGGPVLINLIHDIDNLRYICGEIRSVYAVTSSVARGFAVEDTASIALEFEQGAVGSILVSDATPTPWSYELTSGENPAYPQTGQDCYHFYGRQGSLAFPTMTLWRYPQTGTAGWYQPLAQHHLERELCDPLTAQLAHFCRVIRGEEAPLVSGQDGLKTLITTLAVLESARCHLPIRPNVLQ